MSVSIFIGHSDSIRNVMFSPNSLQLASGSFDRTVRLWDVTTAGAAPNLTASQSDKVQSVAFSPDGSRVISGGNFGTVRQYDGATGDYGPWDSCEFNIDIIVFSPDGRRIAAAGWSEDIRTWNIDTGVDEYVLQGHSDWVYSLVYSPDSQWIASGGYDKTVRLWYACSGASGLVLSGHDDVVYAVAFSPCGLQLVSGSEDGTIRVWDVGTGESRVAVDIGYSIDHVTIRYSPMGMQIALRREWSKHVELWHEESVEPLHSLKHDARVGTISLSPCGHWIATECNGSMWLWRLIVRDATQEWELALVMRDVFKYSDCIGWRPDAVEFVTAGRAGSVHAWKLVETSESGWSVRLIWSSGRSAFTATDSNIVDVVGLSVMNQRLLEQRGAKGVSLST
jgi:WD40 repeat protein